MTNNNKPNLSRFVQYQQYQSLRRSTRCAGVIVVSGSMSLSVVSVAMHLSGLDAQHFTSGDQKVRWLYEDSARKLHASSPALSTTSTASSSGFNSWASDQNIPKEDVTLTPSVSVQTPKTEKPKPEPKKEPVIMYEGRDILDLGSNLRDPRWNFRPSELPKDPQHFFNNRSQYSRINGDQVPLHVDVQCEHCGFVIPYYD